MKHILILITLFLLTACAPPPPMIVTPTGDAITPTSHAATPTILFRNPETAPIWLELLQKEPYPYTTPIPAQPSTTIDGFYAKIEFKEGTPVPCKRCADYLPEGGAWKLHLDQGAFRVFHEYTGWRSLGSFAIDGEHVTLFNDPTCPRTTGIYTWRMTDGVLKFDVIEDDCQVNRRSSTFANTPWRSCQPKDTEAAISDHWPKPPGCENLK